MPDYPLTTIGGGYDDIQNTAPSDPSVGDTWLDTSTDPPKGKIYADLGGGGQWTTNLIDASISSRSAHGDPDPNGYIDAPVSDAGANALETTYVSKINENNSPNETYQDKVVFSVSGAGFVTKYRLKENSDYSGNEGTIEADGEIIDSVGPGGSVQRDYIIIPFDNKLEIVQYDGGSGVQVEYDVYYVLQ